MTSGMVEKTECGFCKKFFILPRYDFIETPRFPLYGGIKWKTPPIKWKTRIVYFG